MKTILVTGGAGYIGSHIVKKLISQQYQVVVLDNFYSGHRQYVDSQAVIVEGNTGNRKILDDIFEKNSIHALIHMAAHIEVGESVENPFKYYTNNTLNSLNVIKASIDHKIPKIIFSSTAAVYGMPKVNQVDEKTPLLPINPYGHSKLMTEQMLQDLAAYSQTKYIILRYFNVAGAAVDGSIGQATPRATHLIKVCCEAACGKRKSVTILGTDYPTPDGTGVRDYIHVDDLASAHIQSLAYLDNHPSDIFNCGYGTGYSVHDIINTIKKISGVDFKVIEGDRRAGDPPSLTANNSKITSQMAWKPQYNQLETICRTAYEWERKLL
ncbi:UDP-glucose 4-epimerase GalE [bacterium]|nr:UDP-glucose 4-epimerase GalE [bacterium]